ncbi:hypothetical protein ACFQ2B_12330 [Streptomyces stramineus]
MHVVDRVEAAPRQEREVAAVPGEDRLLVLEAAVGDVHDEPVREPGHLDLAQGAADAGVRPGQPGRVRGEREVAHGPVGRPDQLADLAVALGRGVDEQEAPVVRGDGQPFAVRCGDQLVHPPDPTGREAARLGGPGGAGQLCDLDRVLALRVRHIGDLPGRAQHLRQPHPHPGVSAIVRAGPSRCVSQ